MPNIELSTEVKGKIAEYMTAVHLLRCGFIVEWPAIAARHDLTARGKSKSYRVQIKWARPADTQGAVCVDLISHGKTYTSNEIDWIAVYVDYTREVYIFSKKSWEGKTRLHIRLQPAKNNQVANTNSPTSLLKVVPGPLYGDNRD